MSTARKLLWATAALCSLLATPVAGLAQTQRPNTVGTLRASGPIEVLSLPTAREKASYQLVPRLLPQFPGLVKPEAGSPAGPAVPVLRTPDAERPSSTPPPLTSFPGPSGSGLEPPDPDVAVGPNDLILSTNAGIQVFSKSGTALTGVISPATFFTVPSSYNIQSDPKFIYDAQSGRYFGVWIGYSSSTRTGAWFVAASTSSSATGSFSHYTITEASQLPDYPGLGVCSDKLVLTANNFRGTIAFSGAAAVAINKSQLTAGTTAFYNLFSNIQLSGGAGQAFTVQPAESLTSTPTCNLVSLKGTTALQLYKITGLPSSTSSATLTTGSTVNLASAVSTPVDAVQLGSSTKLDTGDTRLLDASYRADNGGSLWTTSNSGCSISGATYTCANLVEIQGVDGTPSLKRQVLFGAANFYYTYPAIRANRNNNAAVIFTRTGSSEYPGLRYATCPSTGTGCNSSVPIVAGGASYTGTRWGDFFGAALDPSDSTTVWLFGEYKGSTSSLWQTFAGSVIP